LSFLFPKNFEPGGPPDIARRPFCEGGVMDWKRELDGLVASTMAFAKDIKPKPISDLAPVVRTAEQALADRSKPIPILAANTLMTGPTSERDDILRRVSNFRKHQEKMTREREDHYLQTRAKMLTALSQHRPGRHSEEMPDGPKQNPRRS
jgi:hypothetical protein